MSEKKEEKLSGKKFLSILGRGVFTAVIVLLLVYVITILSSAGAFFNNSAIRGATVNAKSVTSKIDELSKTHYDNLYGVDREIRNEIALNGDNAYSVVSVLSQYKESEAVEFGDLRFFNKGTSYDPDGIPLEKETSGNEYIQEYLLSSRQGCTPVYFDEVIKSYCMAFFIPIGHSQSIDGLMSIIKVTDLIELDGLKELNYGQALILTDDSGTVHGSIKQKNFYQIPNDVMDFMDNVSGNVDDINAVYKCLKDEKPSSCIISASSKYAMVCEPIEALDGNLKALIFFERDALISEEISYIGYIFFATAVAIACFAVALIYSVGYYKRAKHTLETVSTTDPVVGCANEEYFKANAQEQLLKRNSDYALLVMEIRQFRYLSEKLDETDVAKMLKAVAKNIETFILPRETFGYLGSGKFAILVLNESKSAILNRTRVIEAVAHKHDVLGSKNERRIFNVGVSVNEKARRIAVQQLLSQALIACESAQANLTTPYVIYNEKVEEDKVKNAKIELEMESALANNEFRLFLQPKYNVAHDKIDSAEALVRWFDVKTGDYRFPGEFIPLFESNGFITKLDHFVYLEVLKYLSAAAERGERIVPISVNVSLVTANSKDFLEFYISNKKKYNIGDNFIFVEFTESFLMEDHAKLYEIVEKLHANGIGCSLDDFGTGYASFNILKDIPIDELKLDRMLLMPGYSKNNDEKLLETIISLAKSLNIRVVQEGVEDKEMFDRVVEKGCDVIQGYYYAKAISLEEFKMFINTNTSIKYKSLVK